MPLTVLRADPSRAHAARRFAARAAQLLVERFGAARVYAFGSLTRPDRFHAGSDLDLAAEGLAPSRYFAAWAAVDRLLAGRIAFDLIRLEDAPEDTASLIRRTGSLLHERQAA